MRRIFLLMTIVLGMSVLSQAQEAADSAGIIRTAMDYAEGWYAGDGEQMEQALHPELAKRTIQTDERGRSRLDQMSALTLVHATRKGWGKQTPPERQIKRVTILTIYGDIAAVKVEMDGWVDLMHIGKYGGEWKIVNVLWAMKPQPK